MKFINNIKKYLKLINKLNFLKTGDIIWIKRYSNEEERDIIEPGHREGPAIVIYKNLFSIYVLLGTSEIKNANISHLYYCISKDKYSKLNKNTYVRISIIKKLKLKNYIWKITELTPEDLNKVVKRVISISRYNYNNIYKIKLKKLKFIITNGDIISFKKQLFYIYDYDNQYFYCYQIFNKNKGNNIINIDNINYSFNFGQLRQIPITKKVKLINSCSNTKIASINAKKEEYQKFRITKNLIKRGYLVKNNAELFYVYGEISNNYLLYKIYRDADKNNDMTAISINRGIYFTAFEQVKLDKNNVFEIQRIASEIEIKNIKYLSKNFKNSVTKQNKNLLIHKNIKEKTIIASYDSLKRYVVIKRRDNFIKYVDLDNYNNVFEDELDYNFIMRKIGVIDNIEFQNLKIQLKNKVID